MKILLTGGGSAGHFYPMIAVAQQVRKISEDNRLLQPEIHFVSNEPYDEEALFRNDIVFKKISTGKLRLYFSVMNIVDMFRTVLAIIKSFFFVFSVYPDVIFTNGGYGAFPVLVVSRFFRIPVVLHISDTVPGRVAQWASKFAVKISIGFPDAAEYLPKEKVAYLGNPLRRGLSIPLTEGAREFLKLESGVPAILVLGGSQGAKIVNDIIVESLPELLNDYQIIHQTGKNNFDEVTQITNLTLDKHPHKDRYKPFKFLNLLALRMAAGASSLVISRSGSSISEIAAWGKPSILIPITQSSGDHQSKNAFSYARTGAATVIKEENLKKHIFLAEVKRIMSDKDVLGDMAEKTKKFARLDAAENIANEILAIALKHEK